MPFIPHLLLAARRAAWAVPLLPPLLLAACAGYSPSAVRPGQTAAEVAQTMGSPTGRYALAGGGERLEYARGPFGKHTYMVDLDAAGRVTGWAQVLTEARFDAIRNGLPEPALRQEIGRPSEIYHIGWQDLDVYAYRYETPGNFCKWFQVTIAKNGTVAETSYGPDPMCEAGKDESYP